jgi:hypothetical protein
MKSEVHQVGAITFRLPGYLRDRGPGRAYAAYGRRSVSTPIQSISLDILDRDTFHAALENLRNLQLVDWLDAKRRIVRKGPFAGRPDSFELLVEHIVSKTGDVVLDYEAVIDLSDAFVHVGATGFGPLSDFDSQCIAIANSIVIKKEMDRGKHR